MVTAPSVVLCYGEQMPDLAAAQAFSGRVVLQPYHPVVQQRRWAEVFPAAQRFVYWNPAAVAPEHVPAGLAVLGYDRAWDLVLPDLTDAAARRLVVDRALQVLDDPAVHGLFVDDLDRWAHHDQRHVVPALLAEVAARAPHGVDWFVNRGFAFWNELPPRVSAVLLEDLTAEAVSGLDLDGLRWTQEVVLPALHAVRDLDADVITLSYGPPARTGGSTGLAAAFAGLVDDDLLVLDRTLHLWPQELSA